MTVAQKMNVEQALAVYVEIAKREGVLRTDNRVVVDKVESLRGTPSVKDAARRLGPFSGWSVQRKRAFSRMLAQARVHDSA